MLKRNIVVVALTGLLSWGATFQAQAYETGTQQEKGQGPMILDYYAPQVIRPGTTWRIYLKAEDKDGNMKYIAAMLWQAGVGYYSTDLTRIKSEDSKELTGYLFLNTPVDQTLIWDRLELTLLIRDGQGNRSEPIKLPLRFDYAPAQEIPQKWEAAAKHRLGAIMIDIVSSHRYNQDGDRHHILHF